MACGGTKVSRTLNKGYGGVLSVCGEEQVASKVQYQQAYLLLGCDKNIFIVCIHLFFLTSDTFDLCLVYSNFNMKNA